MKAFNVNSMVMIEKLTRHFMYLPLPGPDSHWTGVIVASLSGNCGDDRNPAPAEHLQSITWNFSGSSHVFSLWITGTANVSAC
jgi:hypothetical protein